LLFSTGATGNGLYARSNMGPDWGNEQSTALGAIPSGLHTYRIERIAGGGTDTIRYSIDGTVVASHVVSPVPSLYVYQEAAGQTQPVLTIDSIDLAPNYAAAGQYESCVLDAGASQPWLLAAWVATLPSGTSVTVMTRTSVDGTAWSAWSAALTSSGAAITSPAGRYLQYRLNLATGSASVTPVVESITFGGDSGVDSNPPAVSGVTVSEITSGSARVSWTTNEPATSQVEYGLSPTYGTATSPDPAMATTHSQVVTNLNPLTIYNYRVVSQDAAGNIGHSANATFTTGLPSLSINDVVVTEGDTTPATATLQVTLSAPVSQQVTVAYATATGTASAADFTAASGTLTFAPGVSSLPINVSVTGDTLSEPNESFFVNLSSPTNATIAKAQGSITIVDNDALLPALSIADISVVEGNSGTSAAVFAVSLSAASAQSISVNYATANGTGTAGSDYVAASGTLTFAPGTTTQSITVTINGDTTLEPDETFSVNLSSPVAATIADASAVGTILNDDDPPAISIGSVSVPEGNSGTSLATFTLTLSQPTTQTATVNYATANISGGATAGSDYVSKSGSVSFTPGTTTATISVTINGDTLFEANETFAVNLTGPGNATIATPQAIGTITNDDTPPTLSIADVTTTETNSSSTVTFTVSLSAASFQTITVNYNTANGTAISGSDYTAASNTLTFSPGTLTKTFNVTILGDTTLEPEENFFVNLNSPVNATIADGQAIATIVDNDATMHVSVPNTAVTWFVGTTQAITWTNNLGTTATVKLEISRDGGSSWSEIAASVQNSSATGGSFNWTVTGPATTRARVRATWTQGAYATDTSNANFTIAATPSITVNNPDSWTAGRNGTVNWSSVVPTPGNIKIELSIDGGATYPILLTASTPNDGSQRFSIQTAWRTSQARLRVTWLTDPSVTDTSNSNFTIF
jgi:hypothetical protein